MLEMTGISKSFFGVEVLHEVSLQVGKGETHALLGENGAGKSTLMNILGGVHEKDSGSITLDGETLLKLTTNKVSALGIAFVHQELNVFNDLKVYEDVFLREEKTGFMGCLMKKEMISEVERLFDNLGVAIDPTALVGSLSTSEKQLLEISKALRRDAKLFILDEPTTSLGNQEIENLFGVVNRLKKEGKSFIFISHKMPEIFAIADKYTVLRNGHYVASGNIADITPEEVTKLMVGDSYDSSDIYETRTLEEPILEMEHLSGEGFSDVTLTIRKGEIFGLTGLKNAGCSELLQCIFGITKQSGGQLKIMGVESRKAGIRTAMRKSIAMLASNRKENSVIPDCTLHENLYISEHTLSARRQHIYHKRELKKYNVLKEQLNIKANSPDDLIVSLSGGNQQKIILARWLNTNAEIFLFDNPTQGIDVGAKSEIYRLITELSKQGKTIIINTPEISEIQKISDRCAVFYHEKLQIVLDRSRINEETIMMYATNAVNIQDRVGKNIQMPDEEDANGKG